MRGAAAITMGLIVIAFGAVQYPHGALGQATAGWTTLLDGSTLSGWNVVGNANWRVADGAVQADSGSGFLVTPMSYGDFQLKVEFWVDPDANSGVFIRCSNAKEITATNAYEVNIFDKRPDQTFRTGGIVDVAKPLSTINAGGQWNTFEITAQGPRLMVTLNGTQTVDVQHNRYDRGPIALQYGSGIVKFRNVQVRPL